MFQASCFIVFNFYMLSSYSTKLRAWYLAFIIFLLPWQAVWIIWPPIWLGVASPYLILSIWATDILMLVAILWSKIWRWRYSSGVIFLAAVLVLNILFAIDPAVAFLKLIHLLLIIAFIIAVFSDSDIIFIRKAVIASAVVQAVFALMQFLTQNILPSTLLGVSQQFADISGASVIETTNGRWLRAYGSFPHPNILGGFLALSALWLVDWYFSVYEKFQKWWNSYGITNKNLWREPLVRSVGAQVSALVGSLVIILFGLFASFSRSALLALAAGIVVYFILKYRKNRIRASVLGAKILIILLAVGLAWSFIFPGLWRSRVSSEGRLEERSIAERQAGFRESLAIFIEHPILGVGLQNYAAALRERRPVDPVLTYQPVHNVPLLILTELGVLGVSAIMFLLWSKRKTFYDISLTPLSLATFTAAVIISFLDHYLWSLHAGLMFWVVIALAAVDGQRGG